ncbi:FHA domain-containing protein [Amycolatopsis sp. PS_44_ISF1]|uniref:FHA domain-containing protein n=1 Tax=Amycolatopsis sp. PS_44_ISF1 TaxID=2974917 RepID=UPI0028E02653|nr:FHA domain-containing protein [Amycolatopsis sp. PS_44_ISF1]MDT8912486.1 FHA domain-containing protein [Amycolatopsis sp. PS_44_ISF1]
MTSRGAEPLGADHGSLAFGVPPAVPGTVFALAVTGGVRMPPRDGRRVLFGRNREDVHVCVGEDDRKVSRRQGFLLRREDSWWMRNTGRLPIRLPGARLLFPEEEPVPLPEGYTAVFVRGSSDREHLLELFVAGADGRRPRSRPQEVTEPPRMWRLSPEERLAVVSLAQRYLLQQPYPQPMAWRQVAEQLAELDPAAGWTSKRVEHLVVGVRARLARAGVAGLTREEVGEPVGNSLNDNLVKELLLSTSLVPPDLALLEVDEDR